MNREHLFHIYGSHDLACACDLCAYAERVTQASRHRSGPVQAKRRRAPEPSPLEQITPAEAARRFGGTEEAWTKAWTAVCHQPSAYAVTPDGLAFRKEE